jgi:hypothetical protein
MNPILNIDRMRVSGGTSPTAINGDHALGAVTNGRPSYVLASGTDIIWSGTYWEIRSASTARWRSASPHGTLPSDVAVWTAENASTGTIAVAALSRGPDPLFDSETPPVPVAPANLLAVAALTGSTLVITGALNDGDDPVVFPTLSAGPTVAGHPSWESGGDYQVRYFDNLPPSGGWSLSSPTATWSSVGGGADATPDLVDTWTPVGDATGTPVVTLVLLAAPGELV